MVDVRQSDSPADILPGRESKGWFNGILTGVFALRVPLLIGVATVAALTLPDQVREIHRILTQERARELLQLALDACLVSLVALSMVLWQTARQHAEDAWTTIPASMCSGGTLRWMLAWGPRVLATLPLLGAALGIWLSRRRSSAGRHRRRGHPREPRAILKQQVDMAREFIKGCARVRRLGRLSSSSWSSLFERNLAPDGSRQARRVAIVEQLDVVPAGHSRLDRPADPRSRARCRRVGVHPDIRAVDGQPRGADRRCSRGTIADLRRADPGDAHHPADLLRGVRPHRQPPVPAQSEPTSSGRPWKPRSTPGSARTQGPQAYRNAARPYPVYVVAAEGGGLYAAYQTAKFLARMQDLCRTSPSTCSR